MASVAVTSLKPTLSYTVVVVVLVACCAAIMTPRLLSAEFGLLDDGTTLLIADAYLHNPLGVTKIEADRGRFRPVYWLYYIQQYPIWGTAPVGYFAVQALALGLTTVLIAQTVADATSSSLAALCSGIAFLIAGPVWEAYYTLSKPEPPLVFFVAAATFCLFRAIQRARTTAYIVGFAIFSGMAYFTKETALVLLPLSVAFAVIAWSKTSARRTLVTSCVINLFWLGVFFLGRWLTQTSAIAQGTDSANYRIDAAQIYASAVNDLAWIVRDFAFAIPLVCIAIFVMIRRTAATTGHLLTVYGGLLSAGWMAIMLPWGSSFEYYLLPVSLGIALMVGVSVSLLRCSVTSRTLRIGGAGISALLACIPLTNGITDGRLQLAIDQTNSALLHQLAGATPQGGTVAANLPNENEYVFEMGLQLRELYGRGDVRVMGFDSSSPPIPSGQYVAFQRLENRPATMPRIATGGSSLAGADSGATSLWSTESDVRLYVVNAEEPLCRAVRALGAAPGSVCRDPEPLFDNRDLVYGWHIGRQL